MKNYGILTSILSVSLVLLFNSCAKEDFVGQDETLSAHTVEVAKHAYILKECDDCEMPLKSCEIKGNQCKIKALASLTQSEWDKYFPEATTVDELLAIDLSTKPAFTEYLKASGFGQ